MPRRAVGGCFCGNGNLVKLSSKPNPNFHPPSLEARVIHDMEGEMWVDCKQERLAAFNGHLQQDVKFGLGLLGHLNKGGHFEVRQAEVVPGHWDMTTRSLEMTGKALLFKSIGVQKIEKGRGFQQVSDDLTLTQAADLLNRHFDAELWAPSSSITSELSGNRPELGPTIRVESKAIPPTGLLDRNGFRVHHGSCEILLSAF